jgi:putative membrane protein
VWRFVWGRLIRDAASQALPLSQLGGMVLGARALSLAGVSGPFATASLVADLGLELAALIFYALLGLGLLWWLRPASSLIVPIAAGLVVMAVLSAAFVAVQVRGTGAIAGWLARRKGRWAEAGQQYALRLPWAMRQIHSRYGTLALAWLLHVVCWLLTGVQAWLTFRLMHLPVNFGAAIVIDSVSFALRAILFMVPSGIGVQEGAYVLLGALFGVGPQTALAVSIVRRGRDLVIAVPALVALQYWEGRQFWRHPAAASGGSEAAEPAPSEHQDAA